MNRNKLWLMACSLLCVVACDDILEKDITDKEVVLVAPGEGVVINQTKVNFLWEPVAGSTGYHLQVVSPSFESPETVALDTFVTATRMEYTLVPGNYEWRISAENSAYYTPYAYRTFSIDSVSAGSTDQNLVLISPADGFVTQEGTLKFVWAKVAEAQQYQVQISGAASMQVSTTDTTLTLGFTTYDDTLHWQVKAFFSRVGKESHSQQRWFYIDRTAPGTSALLTPQAAAVVSPEEDITFSWEKNSAIDFDRYKFSLYEKQGEQLVPVSQIELKELSTIHLAAQKKLAVGQYLWEVQTIDHVGNISTAGASSREFEVK